MNNPELKEIIDRQIAIINQENWLDVNFDNRICNLSDDAAFQKPLPEIHSVAELVSHLTVWKEENIKKLNGNPATLTYESPENWKPNSLLKEVGWKAVREDFYRISAELIEFLEDQNDAFLNQYCQNSKFTNRTILEGLIQHDVYHLGQIGITLKLIKPTCQ
ncbi:hypothetical protein AS589_16175 [Empedobacter brevis]|uniref:DinB family protein n=1 Tax=Flavobacteriales TaxID=200644 RepID=UPI001320202F|nr:MULTISPECIES: DinB family protein [Flavobacteriales]QHC86216.1 hypothetical protein AS589_16175 [Empedobacter brevis]